MVFACGDWQCWSTRDQCRIRGLELKLAKADQAILSLEGRAFRGEHHATFKEAQAREAERQKGQSHAG